MSSAMPASVCVVGFGRTGQGVARVLSARAVEVVATDDNPSAAALAEARRLGIELIAAPERQVLADLVRRVDLVVVSPGVAPSHVLFSVAAPDKVVAEIELAYRLASMPILAVTGTNGKTTVTALLAAMLVAAGRRTRPVGNFGPTLIEAVTDPALDLAVAEVSSFQLALTSTFRPSVATWLNFAEDHLDWHRDLAEYAEAKARIFANQDAHDVAVVNGEDPVVLAASTRARSRVVTFGRDAGDYTIRDGVLLGPGNEELVRSSELVRSLPHDELNALAAIATAHAAGAPTAACRTALAQFVPLPHRVSEVASFEGITYVDDSKATTPSAVIAALEGFTAVVLIAGGRNKGLDLGEIGRAVARRASFTLRAVVAIGEAADEVAIAFGDYAVVRAASMDDAVQIARTRAERGDVVLLSPGCASFDWYTSYEERGEDFARVVGALACASAGSGS